MAIPPPISASKRATSSHPRRSSLLSLTGAKVVLIKPPFLGPALKIALFISLPEHRTGHAREVRTPKSEVRSRTAKEVRQICNLPYRRLAVCGASEYPDAAKLTRACRLQIGDTAD